MPHLILALLALGIAATQAGIGGVKLIYALPAYGIIGLAAVCSVFEPVKRISVATSVHCIIATLFAAACIVLRALYSPVDYLARHDLFMTLAALSVYLLSAIFISQTRPRHLLCAILFVFAGAHLACGVVQFRYDPHPQIRLPISTQSDDPKAVAPETVELRQPQFMFFSSPAMQRTDSTPRASGFYLSPNHLAGLLEMLGLMAASLACWSNWRLVARVIAGYTALLCFIGVVLTGSRGGYVSTLAGLLVFAGLSLYVVRRLRPAHFWPTVVGVLMFFSTAIGGGGALMLKSQTLATRLGEYADAIDTRFVIWDGALKQLALSPRIGTGSGTHSFLGRQLRVAPIDRDGTHVQNDYLELLCEYGIVGGLAMAAFVGVHVWSGIGGLRRILGELDDVGWGILNDELALLLGAFSAIAALLVHSVFDFNLHVPGNALVVAFLFSIVAAPTTETLLPEESVAPPLALHWLRFIAPVIGLYLIVVGTPRVEAEYYAQCAEDSLGTAELENAARCADSGIAVEKKNPQLFLLLGKARYQLALKHPRESAEFFRDSHEALGAFRGGLELFPNDIHLLLERARAFDYFGRFAEAESDYKKALAADPNSAQAQARYGQHFQIQNDLRQARIHFARAVEIGGPNSEAAAILDEIRAKLKRTAPKPTPP